MSRVVITSKTRMGNNCCVGAFDLDQRTYLRLLLSNGSNQPSNTPYEVGQYWDMVYTPKTQLTPPHVEDVLVTSHQNGRPVENFTNFLLTYVPFYQGNIDGLFGGAIRFTSAGGGYISHQNGLPANSVGFWASQTDLTLQTLNDKNRYATPLNLRSLPYVGFQAPVQVIPRGTLIRVSLARWWAPADDAEQRCYVQLSGWYS